MIEIAPFENRHLNGVAEVILPIQQAEFGIPITLEEQPDLRNIHEFYQSGVGNFWVALDGDRVVGTIGLLDIGNNQVALRKMFVSAAYRGAEHRVAARLLQTSIEWCLAQHAKEIFLGTTAKFLAAHRFYEKNDFSEVARDQLPAGFPVMTVDTKFYRRAVNP